MHPKRYRKRTRGVWCAHDNDWLGWCPNLGCKADYRADSRRRMRRMAKADIREQLPD